MYNLRDSSTALLRNPKNSLTQDHAAIFEDTKFAAGIEIGEEFVVPSIGTDIQICVENLTNVVIGSYVWNPAYGYLKIVHWDECLKNRSLTEDISGAAIPGTVVSEGLYLRFLLVLVVLTKIISSTFPSLQRIT